MKDAGIVLHSECVFCLEEVLPFVRLSVKGVIHENRLLTNALAVLTTASGTLAEKALVDKTKCFREVDNLVSYLW